MRQWFEQALVETVIGVQQLRGSKERGPEDHRKGPVARSPHERGDAAISCLHSV